MTLLDEPAWQRNGSSSAGAGGPGSGGVADVIEPATGDELGRSRPGHRRRRRRAPPSPRPTAQRDWAATAAPGAGGRAAQGRRPVGRARRGDLLVERPRGRRDPRPMAGVRPARRRAGVLRGGGAAQPRLRRADPQRGAAAVDGPPGAGRRGRRDLAVQRADHPRASVRSRRRSPSATPCILKPDPRTAVTGGVTHRPDLRGGRAAPGVLQVLPGGADVGEAMVTHPLVRVISFTGSTAGRAPGRRAGRQAPQARPPRTRRQLGADRAGRRRRRRGGHPGRLGLVLPPGPDLHDHRPAPRARAALRRLRRAARRRRPATCRSATRPATEVALGPVIDAGQRDKIHGLVTASAGAGARVAAGGTYDDLFYRPTVLADVPPGRPGVRRGGLRPGRAGRPVQHRRRGRRAGRGHATTGCRWASSPAT